MAAKAVITGVAGEWEQCATTRRLLLDSGSLLQSEIPGQLCDLTVKMAGVNRACIQPLAKRMRDGSKRLVMVTIPDLITENLG